MSTGIMREVFKFENEAAIGLLYPLFNPIKISAHLQDVFDFPIISTMATGSSRHFPPFCFLAAQGFIAPAKGS